MMRGRDLWLQPASGWGPYRLSVFSFDPLVEERTAVGGLAVVAAACLPPCLPVYAGCWLASAAFL